VITEQNAMDVRDARAAIKAHKERIKRLRSLDAGAGGEFWDALKGELEASIKTLDFNKEELEMQTVENRDAEFIKIKTLAAEKKAMRGIIYNVTDARQKIDALNHKIGMLTKQIEDIESGKATKGGIV